MIFDIVTKIFFAKSSGWNKIMAYIKKSTHSLVYGYKLDIEKILMPYMKNVLSEQLTKKGTLLP